MQSTPNQDVAVTSLKDIIGEFKKKKRQILIIPIVFVIITAIYIVAVPPLYEFTNHFYVRTPRFTLAYQIGGWTIGGTERLSLGDFWDITSKIILLKAIKDKYHEVYPEEKEMPGRISINATSKNVFVYKIVTNDLTFCKNLSEIIYLVLNENAKNLFLRRAILIAATKSQNDITHKLISLITGISPDLKTKQESLKEESQILDKFIADRDNYMALPASKSKGTIYDDDELLSYRLFKQYDIFFNKKLYNALEQKKTAIDIDAIKNKRRELVQSFMGLQKMVDTIENPKSVEELGTKLEKIYKNILSDLTESLPIMSEKQVLTLFEPRVIKDETSDAKISSNRLPEWAIVISSLVCGLAFGALLIVIRGMFKQ